MYSLGALGGALSVIGWGALNTYLAIVQGNFRNSHPGCHSIADMSEVLGGKVLKEVVAHSFWPLTSSALVQALSESLLASTRSRRTELAQSGGHSSHNSCHGSSLCSEVPPDRLAHLGWIHLDLHRSVHRCRRSHHHS